jgi:hypothetical protein
VAHQAAPAASVLIARASLQDPARFEQTLQALHAQRCSFAFEVVVVDRVGDAAAVARRHPGLALHCHLVDRDSTLPQMWWQALQLARGRIVAVTEDHCMPEPDWLQQLHDEFARDPTLVGVSGCVINGLTGSALDWATYLCEYAAFAPPVPRTDTPVGMNIAYLRERLVAQPPQLLTTGFWDATLLPPLRAGGARLLAGSAAHVRHCKHFGVGGFLQQRYLYSRHYAGTRFERWPARLLAALSSPLLPPLLLVRLLRVTWRRPGLRWPSVRALPYLALFFTVWAWGECVGYALGPSDALRRIE